VQEGIGKHKGYEYARTQNLTREAWEGCVAALERGAHGIAFASGLAAIQAIAQLTRAGDSILLGNNVYGGTFRLLDQVLQPMGLRFSTVPTEDLDAVREAMTDGVRMLMMETPTNPVMTLSDINALAELCRSRDVLLVVDNTFMTPYYQSPLQLGADIVVHSATKYLNGHSDMVGGITVTSNDALGERLRFLQNAAGAVPGPFDCWLALRGVKTLALRMEKHAQNAMQVARFLETQPSVERVLYPGLKTHPQYELACRQMRGFGGMVSVDVGSFDRAAAVLPKFKLFALAESLGGVESLISHPATMTHAAVPRKERENVGLTDGLIRFSVGCEDAEDLIEDIKQALS
jgi:cystathionine beta-lyase/cystathionine gamma-synthase